MRALCYIVAVLCLLMGLKGFLESPDLGQACLTVLYGLVGFCWAIIGRHVL